MDVLRVGHHLSELNYREILYLVRNSPRESAYFLHLHGEQSYWGATEHLLATNADILNMILWLTSDTKQNQRPKPLPRPGVPEKSDMTFGGKESAVLESKFWDTWNDGLIDDEGSQT